MKTTNNSILTNQLLTKNVSIMKTLTLNTMAILMSLLMVLSSCSKNNDIISPTTDCEVQLMSQLEKITNQHAVEIPENSRKWKWWPWTKKVLTADATAYLGGIGTVVTAPYAHWMAIAGSIIAGTGSYTPGGGGAWPYNNDSYIEVAMKNNNNPYDFMGAIHNQGLEIARKNHSDWTKANKVDIAMLYGFVTSNSAKIFNPIKTHPMACPQSQCPSMPCVCDQIVFDDWFLSFQTTLNDAAQGIHNLKKKGYIKGHERAIMNMVFKNIKNKPTLNDFQNYVIAVENILVADKWLSDQSKERLLCATAVARYSATYWNSVNTK